MTLAAALRRPVVHFLALGGLLFAISRLLYPAGGAATPAIVITATQIAAIRSAELERNGRVTSGADLDALIDAAIVDEILVREARARQLDANDAVVERRLVQNMRFVSDDPDTDAPTLLRQAQAAGLQHGDPVVRRRLVQKMRAVLENEGAGDPPTDAELRSYFQTHSTELTTAPAVELTHVFYAGPDARAAALAGLAELTRLGIGPGTAANYGDAFFAGTTLPSHSQRGLSKLFGEAFAEECAALPEGRWSGPILSAYGAHLVWIHHRTPGYVPQFETVRGRVREHVLAERAQRAVQAGITRLRQQYSVTVERFELE